MTNTTSTSTRVTATIIALVIITAVAVAIVRVLGRLPYAHEVATVGTIACAIIGIPIAIASLVMRRDELDD